MNYTEIINSIQQASLFDLYRLSVAIGHTMEDPQRIQMIRQSFKEGDALSYFDITANCLQNATVIQKNLKWVIVQNNLDHKRYRVPYGALNLHQANADIHASSTVKLTKNHLKIGDYVGFHKEGERIVGVVTRLNYKTANLSAREGHRWRVSYSMLFKVIDSDVADFLELSSAALRLKNVTE